MMKNTFPRLLLILVAAVAMLAGGPAGAQTVLDKVVITGSRIFSDADRHMLEQEALMQEIDMMWDLNDFMQLAPTEIVATVIFTPCGSNPKISQQTKNTTSQDADPVRQVAGTNIIDAALGQRTRALDGKSIEVMYSDGGVETYTYNTYGTVHHAKGDVKGGTGVAGSACSAG